MKFAAMAVNKPACHGWVARAPAGTRMRPIARQKPGKVATAGRIANLAIAASGTPSTDTKEPAHRAGIGLVGLRRKQDHADGGEDEGLAPVRPCRDDPEQRHCANRHEDPRRVEQGREPIGYLELTAEYGRSGSAWKGLLSFVGEECQPIERLDHAPQGIGGAVGQKLQRRRPGRQPAERPFRIGAQGAQPTRRAGPNGRIAGCCRRTQSVGQHLQDRLRCLRALFARKTLQVIGDGAPAGQRRIQPVHRDIQLARVIAHVGGFADRLIEDRAERDGARHQLAPYLADCVGLVPAHQKGARSNVR